METIPNNKEECVKWLKEHNIGTTGTLQDLQMKIRRFKLYPSLTEKLRKRAESNFSFYTSLNPADIPQMTAAWNSKEELYPRVTATIFKEYASKKREGSLGQQQKAYSMLTSRKITSIKTLKENDNTFVRALIKKSYGTQVRPAVILFQSSVPVKAYCECPVGVSGLCCHALAVLLFLKHYSETKEKIFELTCTEQLQKWHRRSKKGSIPMMPLRKIKLTSARAKQSSVHDVKIIPADSQNSSFKRDVLKMKAEMKEKLTNMDLSFENHCYNVLLKSNSGKTTSLMGHLNYKYTLMAAECLADHDYCRNDTYNLAVIKPDSSKIEKIKNNIERAINNKIKTLPRNNNNFTNNVNNDMEITLLYDDIKTQISENVTEVNLNINNLQPKDPNSQDNYVDVKQNTDDWQKLRQHKVTGSRLPALIGIHGKNKFETYWKIVLEGLQENEVLNNNFHNFVRGHTFENEALAHFCKISGSKAVSCGFFNHPSDRNYGASPDGLVAPGILLEIKTRAANSEGPLISIPGSYFIQSLLQMICTNSDFCILMSYHPESTSANYFLIQRHNLVWSVIKTIIDSIINQQPILEWPHKEHREFITLEKNTIGRIPNFESLKPLRVFVNKLARSLPRIKFTGC